MRKFLLAAFITLFAAHTAFAQRTLDGLYIGTTHDQIGSTRPVANVAALRAMSSTFIANYVDLASYYAAINSPPDGGGGLLALVPGPCRDNGSTIFKTNDGRCFQRVLNGAVLTPLQSGCVPSTANNCTLSPKLAGTVAGKNLIQSPTDFSGTGWSANNVTTAQAQGTAPDGTNTFNTITDTVTNASHIAFQSGLNPNVAGVYTYSVFLAQGTLRWGHLQIFDVNGSNSFGAIVDLQTGKLGVTNNTGSPVGTSATIVPCTSVVPTPISCATSSYLVTITMSVAAGVLNVYASVDLSNSATPSYDGSGRPTYSGSGQNIKAWGAVFTYPASVGAVYSPPAPPWITAGYTVNTWHVPSFSTANVDTALTGAAGFDLYLTASFGFPNTNPAILTFNGNGSLTVDGFANRAGSGLYSIAAKATPANNWHGRAFGGGAYFEATLAFLTSNDNSTWPAFWADPVEHGAEGSLCSEVWVGQTTSPCFVHYLEMDFFEDNASHHWQYAGTVIDWSGVYNGSTYPNVFQNTVNRVITLPVGTDFTQPHRYGFLWIPATLETQGVYQWYFDGLPTSDRVTYNYYNCAAPPVPPASFTTWQQLYGVGDCLHEEIIMNPASTGTGAGGTLTIYSIDVWQASAANNLVQ